eukprot:NODE_324_length_1891_cov_131.399566_g233_i0.p1 GENE.NODE_324_length_1891_cov_131.399566_g233_i0~~NODE_324_length_1891_cov_131.399566_g233_i0.p1  ORF type:complete len:280 (+),score=38.60 NODE_324_length_1891_cov_131.399566_g233_i0:432-1271(+)
MNTSMTTCPGSHSPCILLCFILTTLHFSSSSHHQYKYQMGQLCWTVVILCITVLQFKHVINNIFTGLVWFLLPCFLVIFNDIAAYFCGFTLGRKIVKAPFLKLSPNKTWEGFIGAFFLTLVFAFFIPKWLVQFPYLTCPAAEAGANCIPHPVFKVRTYVLWPSMARLYGNTTADILPFQLHSLALGTFASLVAPFGGFFASAIKRAYKVKDFDSLIPGHGGVMDRMDCQFLMGLATSVHIATFVRTYAMSVPNVMRYISRMTPEDQQSVLDQVTALLAG